MVSSISLAQSCNIVCTTLTITPQIRWPRWNAMFMTSEKTIGHKSCKTTITIGEGVNPDKPVMDANCPFEHRQITRLPAPTNHIQTKSVKGFSNAIRFDTRNGLNSSKLPSPLPNLPKHIGVNSPQGLYIAPFRRRCDYAHQILAHGIRNILCLDLI